ANLSLTVLKKMHFHDHGEPRGVSSPNCESLHRFRRQLRKTRGFRCSSVKMCRLATQRYHMESACSTECYHIAVHR
uniref:Huntingtin n=1 Tax=Parascaris univalens TaxID=6257 RepID=A0A915BFM9_PARUN